MFGLWKRKLSEDYSVVDSTGNYKGTWFRSMPKNPSAHYRYCLGVENLQTGKKILHPAKKIFYYGNDIPHFQLHGLNFTGKGLVAEVREIKDVTGQDKLIHRRGNNEN